MHIEFTYRNAVKVILLVDAQEAEIVMRLLSQIPDSEFISHPQVYKR